jgi:hypothetical protein
VGQFAVKAGHDEFVRRSEGWFPRPGTRPTDRSGPSVKVPAETSSSAASAVGQGPPPSSASSLAEPAPGHGAETGAGEGPGPVDPTGNGHIPTVSTLSIPGFDALSASQVVQRLDGLNRSELVSVRAYEASTRGRRTILSRVDQLLDERS